VNTNGPRTPPETAPEIVSGAILAHYTVPKLREYFLAHWDWYTLQTLIMLASVSEMEEEAQPHVIAMRNITIACSRVLMNRFGYSAKKSISRVENWLDTGYALPDDE
jgi:hypothetical protein